MRSWKSDEGNRVHLERKELRKTGVSATGRFAPTYYITTATTPDIIACLNANPEVASEVHAGLHEHLRSGVVHSAVFEAMRDRVEQAERDLAALHELIHSASGLDDHRYSPEQMVKEMAERWQCASDDCEKAERERDEARAECDRRERGSAYWNVRFGEECEKNDALRSRIAKLESVVDAAWDDVQSADALLLAFEHGAGGTLSERVEQVTRKSRAALRALYEDKTPGSSSGLPDAADAPQATAQPEQRNESPQDALGNGGARGTFPGGSGAATSTGTSPAPEAGSTPEPAGSSRDEDEAALDHVTACDNFSTTWCYERGEPICDGCRARRALERRSSPETKATRRELAECVTRAELVEALRAAHATWCRDMGATRTQVGDVADALTGSAARSGA